MHRTITTLTATGLLVAALSACSAPVAGVARPVRTATAPGPAERPRVEPTAEPRATGASRAVPDPARVEEDPYDRVLRDADAAQELLDAFWTEHLLDRQGLAFDPPDRLERYVDDGNGSCGDEYADGEDNAYYCSVDDDEHVAFDLDWLASYLPEHPGDAITFLVLAHEWGHAVQDTWVEQEPGADTWTGPAEELNADCLAGVFWDEAVRSGALVEEEGDADAVFEWLAAGGSGTWTEPGDHGTSEQRQVAFTDGVLHGVDHCRQWY